MSICIVYLCIFVLTKRNKMNTTITNTTQLTENQENKIYATVQKDFETTVTEDYTHFEMLGNRLNFDSFQTEVVFEVHSSKGSFNISIELNGKKQPILKTIKYESI